MPRALVSVSDKRGIVEFARGLAELGWEILCTEGTASALSNSGLNVEQVEKITGFPELLEGRVKTLHPAIHAAILARHDVDDHMASLREHGFEAIDLVVVNLYPFRETISASDTTVYEAIEQIDIGGPAMLRSAAKNHQSVIVVVDPDDYERVLKALKDGEVDTDFRRELAAKVFSHTAAYDAAIAQYLQPQSSDFPSALALSLDRIQVLRYGENPQQRAALYGNSGPSNLRNLLQLHGKELSFNNLLDLDAATSAIIPWPDKPACVIIKHTTPCGIALGKTAEQAYRGALATDPTSAFGSVVAFNTAVDAGVAELLSELFMEVVVAPTFHDDALDILRRKKNLRIIELPLPDSSASFEVKQVRGGLLVQDRFLYSTDESNWKIVTKRDPSEDERRNLRFAWAAVAIVKSNAILLAKNEAAIGIGAGQMSRVDSSFLAVHKARTAGHDPRGAVLASDAFFPFPDGVDEAASAGVTAIIQPGGSIRDKEVIAAADEQAIAMIFTSRRQFRH